MKPFLSLIVVLAVSVVAARAGDERDGSWWRQQPAYARVIYVLGAMDGLSAGSFVASASGGQFVTEYNARTTHLLGHARAGQLTDGLNTFYVDFRNRSILVGNALCIVAAQIGGMPDREAAQWIEIFRRAAHESDLAPMPPAGPQVTVPKKQRD